MTWISIFKSILLQPLVFSPLGDMGLVALHLCVAAFHRRVAGAMTTATELAIVAATSLRIVEVSISPLSICPVFQLIFYLVI
jgi:hypothetical protein